jgi:hypothetical protein
LPFRLASTSFAKIRKRKALETTFNSHASLMRERFRKAGIAPEEIAQEHLISMLATLPVNRARPDQHEYDQFDRAFSERSSEIQLVEDQIVGVIVETRPIAELEYAITNVARLAGCKVQLFHGPSNTQMINTGILGEMVRTGQLATFELPFETLNRRLCNAILLHRDFWNALIGRRKILFFQTDSLCCENAEYSLNDFMDLDYVGASWTPQRSFGLVINSGSGGFSFRDWHACVSCLERFDPLSWIGGEDDYFGFFLELTGRKVADLTRSAKFATQSQFAFKSFGAHRVECLSQEQNANFLKYCPEARNILAHAFNPNLNR